MIIKDYKYLVADTDRDTHFQGFTDLLQSKLESISPCTRQEASLVIAQSVYDLVVYVMSDAPVTEWEWDMRDIKDLTEWPTPQTSEPQDRSPD